MIIIRRAVLLKFQYPIRTKREKFFKIYSFFKNSYEVEECSESRRRDLKISLKRKHFYKFLDFLVQSQYLRPISSFLRRFPRDPRLKDAKHRLPISSNRSLRRKINIGTNETFILLR